MRLQDSRNDNLSQFKYILSQIKHSRKQNLRIFTLNLQPLIPRGELMTKQTTKAQAIHPLPRLLKALLAASLMTVAGLAQAWTDKPVKLLVPAPAGGTMDVVARVLASQLSADIGQPVIVDNKPGAGGGIAVQAMMTAPADGQTIMVTASNVLTEIPHVMKTGFDPLKDVKPIATLARAGIVLVGSPTLPADDLKALIARARFRITRA